MNVHDFLSEADIEGAPEAEEDRFAHLATQAERRLSEAMSRLPEDNDSWRDMHGMQYSFMNVVIALAKAHHIEGLSGWVLPKASLYKGDGYSEFRAEFDHWLTQHLVAKAVRLRRDSIKATPEVKEAIRTHVYHIKTLIDKAELSDILKERLRQRLIEFEKALDFKRISLLDVSRLTFDIIALSANVMTLADSASLHKLVTKLNVAVGEEQAQQNTAALLTSCSALHIDTQPTRLLTAPSATATNGFGQSGQEKFPRELR